LAWSNAGLLEGDLPITHPLDPDNDAEIKNEAEQKKLYRMAKVHDCLEIWQGSENLHSTQKAARAENPQMTAMGYISDTEETVKSYWSAFQSDGAAAFQLTEKSPLPPTLLQINLPEGKTEVLNIHRIQKINWHPGESFEDCAAEDNSDTEDWLNWTGHLDDPNNDDID
jgi:hypothetical protein